jgi:hypothetical protein
MIEVGEVGQMARKSRANGSQKSGKWLAKVEQMARMVSVLFKNWQKQGDVPYG